MLHSRQRCDLEDMLQMQNLIATCVTQVPLMVVAWSGLSYALRGAPAGIPRRVLIPNTWASRGNWSVVRVRTLSFVVRTQSQVTDPARFWKCCAGCCQAGEGYQRAASLLDLDTKYLCQIEPGILSQTGTCDRIWARSAGSMSLQRSSRR